MRLVGATAGQVRRMIADEALAAAIIGGAIGCAAGFPLAVPIARALARAGVAPDGFHASISWIPLLAAFGTGLLVCEIAVAAAAWRAGRVRRRVAPRGLAGTARPGAGPLAARPARGRRCRRTDRHRPGRRCPGRARRAAGRGRVALLAPVVLGFPAAALSYPLRTGGGAPGLLASAAITANRRVPAPSPLPSRSSSPWQARRRSLMRRRGQPCRKRQPSESTRRTCSSRAQATGCPPVPAACPQAPGRHGGGGHHAHHRLPARPGPG